MTIENLTPAPDGYSATGKELIMHDPGLYGVDGANSSARVPVQTLFDAIPPAPTNPRVYTNDFLPPNGVWKAGDLWVITDYAGNINEVRLVTTGNNGWTNYSPYPLNGQYNTFSPLYGVIVPNDGNGNNGDYCWMAALPSSAGTQYGPKNPNIWAEFFQKVNGSWVSVLQVICASDPYASGHAAPTDGVLDSRGERVAMYNNDGLATLLRYEAPLYQVMAKSQGVMNLGGNPTANEIPDGKTAVVFNYNNGTTRLWANAGGNLKSVALS